MLTPPIHEHSMSLPLFIFLLISFTMVVQLSVYKSCTCFVRVTPIVLSDYKWYYIFNFSFHIFIVCIQKCNRFSFVDFVSWGLNALTYQFEEYFGFCFIFLEIFCINNHVICKQGQFGFFFSICMPLFPFLASLPWLERLALS